MKQVACNYAPIRFLPYREVGEFINIGVVVHCPQTDYFGFKTVSPKRTRRITGFFPELDVRIFKSALEGINRELKRIQAEHQPLESDQEVPMEIAQAQIARFSGLVRKREGLLYFGDAGTLMATNGRHALDILFARYVERYFAQSPEYHEVEMRRKLDEFLRQWNLGRWYEKNKEIGDEEFHIVMPFVHCADQRVEKVIRPLDLNKKDTTDIYQHGGTWVKNMERLKTRGALPAHVIFTVDVPHEGKRLTAAQTICDELRSIGVEPVDFNNVQELRAAVKVESESPFFLRQDQVGE
jgi:hypothetical protein